MTTHPSDPSHAWGEVFKEGDVVRWGSVLGVVLGVVNYSPDETRRYELHVDAARDGTPVGVECWEPWDAVLANDPASVAEARRLGLRGLPSETAT